MAETTEMERWERKDVRLGALFLFAGALMLLFAVALARNDWPIVASIVVSVPGVILALLGVNAVVRSLRAPR